MAEEATKTAPKRKTTARKTAPKRKTAPRKTAAQRKPAPKRKAAPRKAAPRKTTARKNTARKAAPRKSTPDFTERAQEAGRNAFLAGLGFYGKAYDQAQERFDSLQSRMEKRRKDADKLYKELVKRGQRVEKDARSALDDLELPKIDLDNLTDRKKLEAQIEKARARLEELRESVGFRSAA